MLLNDKAIRNLCVPEETHGYKLCRDPFNEPVSPMIEPFSEAVSGGGVISYGLTSAGYDLRLAADEVLLFKNLYGEIMDPKFFAEEGYRGRVLERVIPEKTYRGVSFILPAGCYCLGRSFEYLRIPRHLKARCVGKSTLARAGILINTTPLEPGWEGHLTIEIGNVTPAPARIYVMEGVAQLEFELLTAPPEVSYADKQGKYQNQTGVTPARVL